MCVGALRAKRPLFPPLPTILQHSPTFWNFSKYKTPSTQVGMLLALDAPQYPSAAVCATSGHSPTTLKIPDLVHDAGGHAAGTRRTATPVGGGARHVRPMAPRRGLLPAAASNVHFASLPARQNAPTRTSETRGRTPESKFVSVLNGRLHGAAFYPPPLLTRLLQAQRAKTTTPPRRIRVRGSLPEVNRWLQISTLPARQSERPNRPYPPSPHPQSESHPPPPHPHTTLSPLSQSAAGDAIQTPESHPHPTLS